MLRLSLAARITLIVVVSLLTVWVAAIAGFYRNRIDDTESGLPDPARIANIVALVERIPGPERPVLLEALATRRLALVLRPAAEISPPLQGPSVADDIRDDYVRVLGGRPLALVASGSPIVARIVPGLFTNPAIGLILRIGLVDGTTLEITTRGPLVLTRFGLPIGFGAGFAGTLIALLALWIMHRETKPLARLAAAVDRLDLSGEPATLPKSRRSAPEIHALIAAFDRLQGRLAGLIKARMALVGGISHDVRTFATRLRLRIERIPDEGERARAIADIDDMIRLLDNALIASRTGAEELDQEMIEFAALAWSEVSERRALGARVDFREAQGAGGALVIGDRLALRRVIANLVDNAIKYGRAAHVSVATEVDTVVLAVDDEGKGIPEGQRAMMLEPFSRLEVSRSRTTGGAGLGLAVVASIVAAHDGHVDIDRSDSGGGRVTVRLPLFRPEFRD